MRELKPNQQRSLGRDEHRARYAAYMKSPAWFHRRERWAAEELHHLETEGIACRGCGSTWSLSTGDLHHIDYARLEDEAHDDLWAMCRTCHYGLHELIESSKSWRKLPRRQANELALPVFQRSLAGLSEAEVQSQSVTGLRDYL